MHIEYYCSWSCILGFIFDYFYMTFLFGMDSYFPTISLGNLDSTNIGLKIGNKSLFPIN